MGEKFKRSVSPTLETINQKQLGTRHSWVAVSGFASRTVRS